MKILLIDDEPTLFKDILIAYKYSVDIATNGYQALKLITSKAKHYDLVLLDIKMPVMDGWEILRLIREDKDLNEVFIIMLTADNTEESITSGLQKGADLYLTKPVSAQCFIEHIKAVERRLQLSKGHLVLPKAIQAPAPVVKGLTKRQLEILTLVSQGLPNKQIAIELEISEATVKNHLASSFNKMSVKNRTQALIAFQQLSNG